MKLNKRTVLSTAALLVMVTATGPMSAAESATTAPAAPVAAPAPVTHEITQEQAVEMALKAHPGKVTKAYEDTKKGKKTWEIKINGDDGKKWEVYYEIKTGTLIAEEVQ